MFGTHQHGNETWRLIEHLCQTFPMLVRLGLGFNHLSGFGADHQHAANAIGR